MNESKHSKQLPKAYKDSAFVLKQMNAKKGSLNSLINQLKQKSVSFIHIFVYINYLIIYYYYYRT